MPSHLRHVKVGLLHGSRDHKSSLKIVLFILYFTGWAELLVQTSKLSIDGIIDGARRYSVPPGPYKLIISQPQHAILYSYEPLAPLPLELPMQISIWSSERNFRSHRPAEFR